MIALTPRPSPQQRIHDRAAEIFAEQLGQVHVRTDRWFAWLLLGQYVAGIVLAMVLSPRTWAGTSSSIHVHLLAAIFLGGLITSLPVSLAWWRPGQPLTRHVIAASQMLTSALWIHLTGGRIETHFHIFGSLAFLAFYRDWTVLATATVVVALDHWLRGLFWPQSVFGIPTPSPYRWLEHAGWVLFEVWFLRWSCRENLREMQRDALQKAALEHARELTEQEVARRTEALARKNQELDEFTYIASHDLQEPVRKLISFSKLLEQDLGRELPPSAAQDLHYIVDAAQRMRDLIQALLALSRTGRSAMHVAPVDLHRCVDQALEALELKVRETGAQITRDALPTVLGDATLLTQLYQNLIGNALKFVPPGRVPCIHLTAQRQGDGWVLGVQDNGIGIAPEYAERIFRPFQRLHSRREYEGTGIGLTICKKVAERHGGQIWFSSQPGEGTHFQFTLGNLSTSEEDERCTRPLQPVNAS
jgi:signal transduction histidine kinase